MTTITEKTINPEILHAAKNRIRNNGGGQVNGERLEEKEENERGKER